MEEQFLSGEHRTDWPSVLTPDDLRLSSLLNKAVKSSCSSCRGYLGRRAMSMLCRHGGGRKGCSGRWLIPSRLEGICLELLLSADCEISVISCTTPALKLPCSCRSISFATGPSMMQRDLTFNASVHSSAAGRRKYEQDETAPAPLGLPAHSHCFTGHLILSFSAETLFSREMNLL